MKCLVIANNKNCIYTRLHYCPNICRIIFLAFFLKRFFYCGFISVAYQQINLILEHNWNSFHHSISNFLNKVAQDLLTFPVFIAFRHFVSFYDGKKKKSSLEVPLKCRSHCFLYIFSLAVYPDEIVHRAQNIWPLVKRPLADIKRPITLLVGTFPIPPRCYLFIFFFFLP